MNRKIVEIISTTRRSNDENEKENNRANNYNKYIISSY